MAGEAHAGLGHGVPFLLPGRAVCPAPGTGGRWTPWPAERAPGQAVEPTKSAIDQIAERARLGCRVGWRAACGWGMGMPAPSGQILHPGRGGRTRLRPRELLAARLRAPTLALLQETHRLRRFLAGSHHTGLATASALTRSFSSRTPTSRKLAASKSSPRASSTGRSSSSVWPPPPERPDGVGELLTVALQPTPLEPVEAGMHLGVAPARIAEAA